MWMYGCTNIVLVRESLCTFCFQVCVRFCFICIVVTPANLVYVQYDWCVFGSIFPIQDCEMLYLNADTLIL